MTGLPTRSLLLLLTLALLPIRVARTQTTREAVAGIQPGCTYASCALRVEQHLFFPRLVRGAAGETVADLGPFGGGSEILLGGPDSVAAHARTYVRSVRVANGLTLAGTVAALVVLVRTNDFDSATTDPANVTIAVTGVALSVAAIPFAMHAYRSPSRAVWWYNAALAR